MSDADKAWNDALQKAITIARRNGAKATVLDIRRLLRSEPSKGETK